MHHIHTIHPQREGGGGAVKVRILGKNICPLKPSFSHEVPFLLLEVYHKRASVCPQCSSPNAVTCFWYNIIARLETAPGKSLNSRQHCFWKYFLWNKGQTANIYLSLLRLVLTLPTVSACLHVPVSRVTCHVSRALLVTCHTFVTLLCCVCDWRRLRGAVSRAVQAAARMLLHQSSERQCV